MKTQLQIIVLLFVLHLSNNLTLAIDSAALPDTFKAEVSKIAYQVEDSAEKKEQMLLSLLEKYKTPEYQGLIYNALTVQFSNFQPESVQKFRTYAQKAVIFPLPAYEKMRLYLFWGSMEREDAELKLGRNWDQKFNDITKVWLLGLKVAKDEKVPDVKPQEFVTPLMVVDSTNMVVGPNTKQSEIDQWRKKHEENAQQNKEIINAKDKRQQETKTFETKKSIEDALVRLYEDKPDGVAKLRQQAKEVTGDDAIAERLANMLSEALAEKAKKEAEKKK